MPCSRAGAWTCARCPHSCAGGRNWPAPYSGRGDSPGSVLSGSAARSTLRVTRASSAALGAVHAGGLLHLDISGGNVVWASRSADGGGCAAFLTDFGKRGGSFRAAAPRRCCHSPGLRRCAPRRGAHGGDGSLPVGMLLFYLCAGEGALQLTRFPKRRSGASWVACACRAGRGTRSSDSPGTAAPQSERYQTAGQMRADVRALLERAAAPPGEPHPGAGPHARVAAFAARGERDGGLWLG